MSHPQWAYPPELLSALGQFGLAPQPETPPALVRDALSDLYRWEIRRLRDRLLAAEFPKQEYLGHVIALRKKYWPLAITPEAWGAISPQPMNQNPGLRQAQAALSSSKGGTAPLRIALIQQHASRDHDLNLHRAVAAVRAAAAAGARVIAFAELAFTRFFPQQPPAVDVRTLAEPVPGPTTEVFSALARELGIVVVLNVFERDGEKTYDCSPVIDADGQLLGRTRMVHITEYPSVHEQQYYHPGDLGAPVFNTCVGRIGVAICYDRHFPEYMRALALDGADLVVVPQAGVVDEWAPGVYEGELQAAAFQNGYFVALCNRVGPEDVVTFAGESFICDPGGRVIARAPGGEDAVLMADLDLSDVARSHARTLLLRDRRPELYGAWLGRR